MMPPSSAPCPLCERAADPLHAPFCSRGCRDRDLLAWLGEGYRLPGRPLESGGLDSAEERD